MLCSHASTRTPQATTPIRPKPAAKTRQGDSAAPHTCLGASTGSGPAVLLWSGGWEWDGQGRSGSDLTDPHSSQVGQRALEGWLSEPGDNRLQQSKSAQIYINADLLSVRELERVLCREGGILQS